MLHKDRLIFDASDLPTSDQVASFLYASDGTALGHTGGDLDVNVTNSLTLDVNGIYHVSTNPTPDNIGVIGHTRAASPGAAEQGLRLTAGAASSDDVVAANVHGLDVNSFLMGYDGATWDRINATAGAMDVNVSAFNAGTLDIDIVAQSVGDIETKADLNDLVADDAVDAGGSLKVGSRAIDGALAAVSADDDRADQISDMFRRVYVNSAPNIGVDNAAETVGVAAAELASTPLAGRVSIWIQNLGSKDVYLGKDNTVTTSNGLRVARGATFSADWGEDVDIWAISGTAGQDVRVFEVA